MRAAFLRPSGVSARCMPSGPVVVAQPPRASSPANNMNKAQWLRRMAGLPGMLAQFGAAPGAIQDASLQLSARRVDVVAACASHRGDQSGLVEDALERRDGFRRGAVGGRAGNRNDRIVDDLTG